MSKRVIIDTNGLMIPGKFGIDIFSELERLGFDKFVIMSSSIRELKNIFSKSQGKDRTAAKIALSLIDRCELIEKDGYTDDIITEISIKKNMAVLTNDIELKKRLCKKGVTVIQLRGKTHLNFKL